MPLYIAEFPSVAQGIGRGAGVVPVVAMPPIEEQVVAISGTANPSKPVSGGTNLIRVNTDTTCSIAISGPNNPAAVATTANARLPANQTEYFSVAPGSIVSVIANT
jgi:hypothetical protein